jgi:RNA polymerase sigma factor (sigma-70 family)
MDRPVSFPPVSEVDCPPHRSLESVTWDMVVEPTELGHSGGPWPGRPAMSAVAPDKHAEDLADLRRFALQGDRTALGRLFTRHADAAYRLARRYFAAGADAEDAVQIAFLRVFRLAGQFRGEATVKAWIMGSVVSACRHKLREEARRTTREQHAAFERPEANRPVAADREQSAAVLRAVQDLPEHYRTPVWLHYYEGMSSPKSPPRWNCPRIRCAAR